MSTPGSRCDMCHASCVLDGLSNSKTKLKWPPNKSRNTSCTAAKKELLIPYDANGLPSSRTELDCTALHCTALQRGLRVEG